LVTLDAHRARSPKGDALAILTISGGPSVVAADAAEAVGLRVPPLPAERRAALRAHLPAFGADSNPVDMTPQMEPGGFAPSVRLVLEAPEVEGAVAIDIGLDRPEYADALVSAQAATGKPIVACTVDTPDMDRRLRAAGIPLVPGPERAVRHAELARRATRDAAPCPRPRPPARLTQGVAATRGPLPHADARALLEAYGMAFPRERTVSTLDEALSAAAEIGYPLVAKTARPDVLHRTEVGGVVLGVTDEAALRRAVHALEARLGPGPLLLQEEVSRGLELLVGGRRDPTFGPVVLVGLGGVLAELLRDVSIGLAPLVHADARAMLVEGRRAALLRGFRGAPAVDEDAVADVLVAIGNLLVDHAAIAELDVNPLIASGRRLVAVDALILVNPETDDTGRATDAT
jgi:acetyltransferase